MKELMRHLYFSNLDEIIEKSYINCHCYGLHSVMLLESPGKTIRMFVAEEEHMMWKNLDITNHENELSIAVHPHHCDITLLNVKGMVKNIAVKSFYSDPNHPNFYMTRYQYNSQIKDGECRFVSDGRASFNHVEVTEISPRNPSISMKANELHTIFVPKGQFAAWLVFEGKEDPNYKSVCFSNSDPNKSMLDGHMYQKATKNDIDRMMIRCGFITANDVKF